MEKSPKFRLYLLAGVSFLVGLVFELCLSLQHVARNQAHGSDWTWVIVGSSLCYSASAAAMYWIFPLLVRRGHWWHKLGWLLALFSAIGYLTFEYMNLSGGYRIKARDIGGLPSVIGVVVAIQFLTTQQKAKSVPGSSYLASGSPGGAGEG